MKYYYFLGLYYHFFEETDAPNLSIILFLRSHHILEIQSLQIYFKLLYFKSNFHNWLLN